MASSIPIEYGFLNRIIERSWIGTTTSDQSQPSNNDNEKVMLSSKIFTPRDLPSDAV